MRRSLEAEAGGGSGARVRLLLATNSAHKRAEIEALLGPLGIDVVTPADVGGIPAVDEDRPTFAGNAAKKAASAAAAARTWALADDSGLAVDALGGAPGVRSARYAGEHGDDAANNARVLAELAALERERGPIDRGARFVCALALAAPGGAIVLAVDGETRGVILREPRGGGGFGYDPLFEFAEPGRPQTGRTFAEIPRAEKSAVSHRGRALARLLARLTAALGLAT
jgi:XTP/dITP diphosphohydrolase